jgi:hypothetical protein
MVPALLEKADRDRWTLESAAFARRTPGAVIQVAVRRRS